MKATHPCAYCGRQLPLKKSHILPRWMIERALAKSPTGRMRDADRINRPVQDGESVPLLCRDCEGRFSVFETAQAQRYDKGETIPGASYDANFCNFVVSILWRVGVSRLEQLRAKHPYFVNALNSAIRTWKEFLDGKLLDFDSYPTYFMFLDKDAADRIFSYREEGMPNDGPAPVLHRFLLNSINTQIVVYSQDGYALAWAMGNSWLMVGVIEVPLHERNPTAIDISLSGGVFPKGQFSVPQIILATLRRQSLIYFKEHKQISPFQRTRILELATRRAAEFSDQSQRLAKDADVAMFGDAANIDLADQTIEG